MKKTLFALIGVLLFAFVVSCNAEVPASNESTPELSNSEQENNVPSSEGEVVSTKQYNSETGVLESETFFDASGKKTQTITYYADGTHSTEEEYDPATGIRQKVTSSL